MPDNASFRQLLERFRDGDISVEEIESVYKSGAVQTSAAEVDLDRQRRCGFAEVIYGPGKLPEAVVEIAAALLQAGQPVLVTRSDEDQQAAMESKFGDAAIINSVARTIRVPCGEPDAIRGRVALLTAGTGDLPVAEEAAETLSWMGVQVDRYSDIGVAGPSRLLSKVEDIRQANVVIVIAGMEGALPSVVGGHVDVPVIAVPTSVGYGTAFGGMTALLGMLNSCSANVTVVNIDAGFKAAFVAGLMLRSAANLHSAPPAENGRQ